MTVAIRMGVKAMAWSKLLAVFAVVLLIAGAPVAGQAQNIRPEAQPAADFIEQMGNRVIEGLRDGRASGDGGEQWFRGFLNDAFDVNLIARFSLGQYWRSASDAEKTAYLEAFENMLVSVYTQRFRDYSGERFRVTSARAESDRDFLVNTDIVPSNGPPVAVGWRVRERDGQLRVVDLVVENVSLLVSQRQEFSSVIQRNGGDVGALIEALRNRAGQTG